MGLEVVVAAGSGEGVVRKNEVGLLGHLPRCGASFARPIISRGSPPGIVLDSSCTNCQRGEVCSRLQEVLKRFRRTGMIGSCSLDVGNGTRITWEEIAWSERKAAICLRA